jgi:predicted RNA binding protein YcfA (HicA-like mRNA interferase family)
MDPERLLGRLRAGQFENVHMADAERLLRALGFRLSRVRGSHRLYEHPVIDESLNLQPKRGRAKAYQMRQIIRVVDEYDLSLEAQR